MIGQEGDALGGELVLLASFAEQRDVTSSPVPEPEVLPYHNRGRMQPVDKARLYEVVGGYLRELVAERQHADGVCPQPAEQFGPVRRGTQQRRMRAWPDDLVRMGIEGDDHERQPEFGADLLRASHNPPVTAVHAVEYADGDDRPAPVRWDVLQTLPAMHRQRPFRLRLAYQRSESATPDLQGTRPARRAAGLRRKSSTGAGRAAHRTSCQAGSIPGSIRFCRMDPGIHPVWAGGSTASG